MGLFRQSSGDEVLSFGSVLVVGLHSRPAEKCAFAVSKRGEPHWSLGAVSVRSCSSLLVETQRPPWASVLLAPAVAIPDGPTTSL